MAAAVMEQCCLGVTAEAMLAVSGHIAWHRPESVSSTLANARDFSRDNGTWRQRTPNKCEANRIFGNLKEGGVDTLAVKRPRRRGALGAEGFADSRYVIGTSVGPQPIFVQKDPLKMGPLTRALA